MHSLRHSPETSPVAKRRQEEKKVVELGLHDHVRERAAAVCKSESPLKRKLSKAS